MLYFSIRNAFINLTILWFLLLDNFFITCFSNFCCEIYPGVECQFFYILDIYFCPSHTYTVLMKEKSGGKIIYKHINIVLLYRGRHYDPKRRPVIPIMLWKPHAPIFPKLVNNVVEGLTFEETKELRSKGLNSIPLMRLSKWKHRKSCQVFTFCNCCAA